MPTLLRILLAIILSATLPNGWPTTASAGSTNIRPALSLKDELEKGLKARRPEEFAFIGRVVAMVDNGQLPLKLVRGTFGWARKKRPYPFPYFERALKVRAAKIGIVVE